MIFLSYKKAYLVCSVRFCFSIFEINHEKAYVVCMGFEPRATGD